MRRGSTWKRRAVHLCLDRTSWEENVSSSREVFLCVQLPVSDRSLFRLSASQPPSLSPLPSEPGQNPLGSLLALRMDSLRLLQRLTLSFFSPCSGNRGLFASFRILSELLAPLVAGPRPDRSS